MEQERTRHREPLALTTAQLVRVTSQSLLGAQTHRVERLLDLAAGLRPGFREPKFSHGYRQQVIDLVERIEHFERILKNRLNLVAEVQPIVARHLPEVLAT